MITTNVNRADYKGDGITTNFPIPFPFIEKSDIAVYIVSGEDSTLLTEDYYIDNVTDEVIYPGYPPGEEKPEAERPGILADGKKIVISRDIKIDQKRDMGEKWPFDECEKALDKLTLICQDLAEKEKRTIRIPISADANGYDATFPYPKEGCTIMWKDNKLVNTDYQAPLRDMASRMEEVLSLVQAAQEDVHRINDEFLKFAMSTMDQCELDLNKYNEELLRQLDAYAVNSKEEILDYVKDAKHYADSAKKAAEFDPDAYYEKEEVDQKIKDAIAAIVDYDALFF